jgi:hypothetical protein
MIDYYYALADGWKPPEDGSTRVIGRMRNQAPLVVERRYNKGRVVAQLTRLSSGETPLGRWTNWSLSPAFPVLANELVNYLAAGRQDDPLFQVGDDLVVSAKEGTYDPAFRFPLPSEGSTRPEQVIDATPGGGLLTAALENVPASGIYEVQLQTTQGAEQRDFAFNVTVSEGDLAITPRDRLDAQLAGLKYELHNASAMAVDEQHLAGFQLSDALLGALVAVLLAEQLLAHMASYHIPPLRGPAR